MSINVVQQFFIAASKAVAREIGKPCVPTKLSPQHIIQKKAEVLEQFFFPALPDKCETWSVNNWNEPVIEIKFPQRKKPTTNPTKTTRQATHTHKPRHEPGKSVREICKLSETK